MNKTVSKICCFFGFHKFGEPKEYNSYVHPFRIITGKERTCLRCGFKQVFDAEVLTYHG
jgi:hypothetical protein